MSMHRKESGLALAAVLAALTACCVFVPIGAAAQGAVEVSYGTFLDPNRANDPRSAAQNKMIEEFERRNPNIKVKIFLDPSVSNTGRNLKGGIDTPDVFRVHDPIAAEYIATGNVAPLDDLIKRDKIDMNDWLIPLDSARMGGKIYGLYQDFRIPILMYRKSKLAEAGVAPPKTWDEVCVTGAKLSKPPVIGFSIGFGSSGGIGGAQNFSEYFLTNVLPDDNGLLFKDDNRTIGFTRASLVKTTTLVRDLFVKCKAVPMEALQFGFNETHDGLRAGTIAMADFGLFRYKTIQSQGAGDDLAWAPPPGYTPNSKWSVYGFQLMMNSNSKVKPQAWELLKWMASPEAQVMAARGGEVVARLSAYKDPYFATPEAADQLKWSELIKQRGRIVKYPVITAQFQTIVGDAFLRMILKNATPEETADEIITKYNEAIAKFK